jgi:hypothetical protein
MCAALWWEKFRGIKNLGMKTIKYQRKQHTEADVQGDERESGNRNS